MCTFLFLLLCGIALYVLADLGLRPNPAAFLKESGAKNFYAKLRFAEEV